MEKPTAGHVVADDDVLRETCRYSKEHCLDRKIYTVCDFSQHNANLLSTLVMLGAGAGNPPQSIIGASLVLSLLTPTAETFAFRWDIPDEADLTKDVDFRVKWSDDAAVVAGDTALFTFLYTVCLNGATAEAVGATAMDTDAPAQLSHGANVAGYTGWNTILAGTLVTATAQPGDDHLNFLVTPTLLATMADCSIYKVDARIRRRYF